MPFWTTLQTFFFPWTCRETGEGSCIPLFSPTSLPLKSIKKKPTKDPHLPKTFHMLEGWLRGGSIVAALSSFSLVLFSYKNRGRESKGGKERRGERREQKRGGRPKEKGTKMKREERKEEEKRKQKEWKKNIGGKGRIRRSTAGHQHHHRDNNASATSNTASTPPQVTPGCQSISLLLSHCLHLHAKHE